MPDEIRYRCELTPELLDAALPELEAALSAFDERASEARLKRVPRRALRVAGLALAALGIVCAWVLIIGTPPCSRRSLALPYASLPVFVVLGTIFAFEPSVRGEVRAWVRRVTARRARRLLDDVRRRVPYEIEYVLSGARLEGHVAKLGLRPATELGRIQAAIACERLACLFARRWPARLRRVVWFPDPAARGAVLAALRDAGVEVTELAA